MSKNQNFYKICDFDFYAISELFLGLYAKYACAYLKENQK